MLSRGSGGDKAAGHGVNMGKGKVLPKQDGGRRRFQTRPATKNAECSGDPDPG